MIFLSLCLFLVTQVYAVDLQIESTLIDNPDKTFIPRSRSAFLISPSLEHKKKIKYAGVFFLVRSKLEYKHDTDARRLREGEASSTVLAIKPLNNRLLGASLSAGHLFRWRRDFNVNTDRFEEIDGDHFFAETRFFIEEKLEKPWILEGGVTTRVEDYASSYSVYVNQQNDNIGASAYSSLAYKGQGFEIKPSLQYNRKLWRERRALSKEGFFVSSGQKLKPDRIDTGTASLKGTLTFDKVSISVTPSWNRINDLNNDGRSSRGPALGSEIGFPIKTFTAKLRADWSKRIYDTQLSSFLSNGDKGLKEETALFSATLSGMIGVMSVELMHGMEELTSNQTDTKRRKIGNIKSSMTSFSLKKTF